MKLMNLIHHYRVYRRLGTLGRAAAAVALARKLGARGSLRWAALAAQAYLVVAEGTQKKQRRRRR
jgi:hypothetical protein